MNRANEDKLEFVSAIITDKEKRPLILKRCNNLRLDPGKYDMCSGHMKNGEIPLQSMYRELNEELGMEPNNILKNAIFSRYRNSTSTVTKNSFSHISRRNKSNRKTNK